MDNSAGSQTTLEQAVKAHSHDLTKNIKRQSDKSLDPESVLVVATVNGWTHIVNRILSQEVVPDLRDPTYLAVDTNNQDILAMLLRVAHRCCKKLDLDSVIDIAIRDNYPECLGMLRDYQDFQICSEVQLFLPDVLAKLVVSFGTPRTKRRGHCDTRVV
jgi:hypothetical protein